ncbi:MAG: hypothetical protein NTW69_06240 [Chloroflexi bacterium]|nr:hypothetical protein [Chloroflexota bacterium]
MNSGMRGVSNAKAVLPDWVLRHPDNPPTNPSVWDDEFNGNALHPKWTTVGAGTPIHTVSNGSYRITEGALNGVVKGIEQPISGNRWKIRTLAHFNSCGVNFDSVGFIVRCSTTTRVDHYSMMHHSSWGYFAPIHFHGPSYISWTVEVGLNQWYMKNKFYLELEYDGTNFIFKHSADGFNFYSISSTAQATYLAGVPTHFGVGSWHNGPSLDVSYSWFRRVS